MLLNEDLLKLRTEKIDWITVSKSTDSIGRWIPYSNMRFVGVVTGELKRSFVKITFLVRP